ncbi:glycine betaine ABC transporter substrate-binding protein [Spirochaeta africana]|uniref:ABC-type proline/glycine betaine transport system, periplasmic component n=1 Tax=Spirochaeta africana (strain ATCC 700263 / DSM 8902 / Z-7692) TaxID=889378 RepID=H9UIA6_SPIAZ|nr:glycine betaine ABC transporter substrate-binding protein [Spirochaeta africana]AFG37249.1 ABC-type proline/glycine betaine transport system, periplasmic component [Spirochaeta africana DSM 8902]
MKKAMRHTAVAAAVLVIAAALVFAGCAPAEDEQEVTLLYVEWVGEVASTYVAAVVLEEMGYEVDTISVSAAAMWEGIASGDGDAMTSAWLPGTHGAYLEQTQDRVEEVGVVMTGARIGLMVPTYVDIDTVADLEEYADRFDNRIVGIDPGAGLMSATEEALEVYGLDSIDLLEGSDATMVAALEDAYRNEEWVVVTGWTPHVKEARFDLKYLEDPELVFGEEEYVASIVRSGLADEKPEVYEFFTNFSWSVEAFADLMLWNDEPGSDPYANAQRWVEENRSLVDSWIN